MIFIFNDKEYNVCMASHIKESTNPSKLHKEARQIIYEEYSMDTVAEEFPMPGTKPKMYLDFYIPARNIAIEVHGEQHFKFNSHFFSSKEAFLRAKVRDKQKQNWCQQNGIILIEVYYNESRFEWREFISRRKIREI